jgi:Leucine-rich repeat (LRR) protein
LQELNCSSNKLNILILPTNITQINCRDNELTAIDCSNCKQLVKLDCRDNELTNLILPPQLQQ